MTETQTHSSVAIVDPTEVKVARCVYPDGTDRIRVTYIATFESEPIEIEVYSPLDDFGSFLVALLNGFGFPTQDLEYVADRIMKILREEQASDTAQDSD